MKFSAHCILKQSYDAERHPEYKEEGDTGVANSSAAVFEGFMFFFIKSTN